MLLHLLMISFIGLAFLAILLYTILTDHKDTICSKKIRGVIKTTIIIFVLLPIIIICSLQVINTVCLNDPVISTTELSEVYKGYDKFGKELYYIKDVNSNEFEIVDVNTIYKGDSNYVIKREYPNISDSLASLIGYKRIKYDLVVINPDKLTNIPTQN